METDKTYTGATEEQIWKQIAADINDDILEYHAIIQQGQAQVYLDIDIDLGGGFEGGYATTTYRAPLNSTNFQFAIHEEHFTDEIGKFFNMQDVTIGYPELDEHLIVKTNDVEKVKTLFTDEQTRKTLTELENFDLGIRLHSVEGSDKKEAFLELNIEDGITDIDTLRELYHAFYMVLVTI
ncbi:MAG: hypothetical protein ABIN91_06360 [Mucilaginibacter sp.]|uniref:hypothetical protein n=1 Tax=Mucilaginibacter sp. TaxID=1882438 RepID=UPI003266B75B